MMAKTTVATPIIKNPKPTSFDDLLGTTGATILVSFTIKEFNVISMFD